LLNRFYSAATQTLLRHDAVIDKLIGDEVMAFFVRGISGPQYRRRAVMAGVELLKAVGYGTAEGPWLELGVAVNAGVAYVGNVGGSVVDFTALGNPVNVSARMQQHAAGGELVVASGVAGPRWVFEGFLPRSGRERQERLRRIADDDRGTVVFEAPGRVAATLRDLAEVCGGERPAAVCRELTKLHETIVRGTLAELAEAAKDGAIPARGEFALVVGSWPNGRPISAEDEGDALEAARTSVERLVAGGTARGDAAKQVASETGIARRQLYGADRIR
jgi:16S rRNA (cytidine(1402)-2'-O)-methyltransferase